MTEEKEMVDTELGELVEAELQPVENEAIQKKSP